MFEIAELFFTKWCLGMSSGTPGGGGDCTNRSKSGRNRGGQIFRSELLNTCNLLKLAMSPHLSLNPRQYITGRGVDQESSTGHLGPMCFGTVDDW